MSYPLLSLSKKWVVDGAVQRFASSKANKLNWNVRPRVCPAICSSTQRNRNCELGSGFSVGIRNSSSVSGTSSSGRGLFSIPELKEPSDFRKLAIDAIRKCDSMRNDLRNNLKTETTTPGMSTLLKLDGISRIVCNVIDAAELCRCVHVNDEWRSEANHAFSYLSDYIAQLNADTSLYYALKQVQEVNFDGVSQESAQFIKLLQAEFERNGIHLPDDERENVRDIQNHITTLETMFTQNIIHDHHEFTVSADLVEEVIPREVMKQQQLHDNDNSSDSAGNYTLKTNQADIINTLLKYSTNRSLRRELFMEYNTACKENLDVLDSLIKARNHLAKTLGFPSYADYFLQSNSILSNPKNVQQFLSNLQKANSHTFTNEMNTLLQIHQKFQLHSNHSTGASALEPWDIPFYTEIAKSSILRTDQDQQQHYFSPASVISKYLTIDNCLDSIKALVELLFNIRMEETDTTPDEQWDMETHTGKNPTKHASTNSSIRRMEFYDNNDDQLLGVMYLDLYKRPGKYNHAAHFTIRCGCYADDEGSNIGQSNAGVNSEKDPTARPTRLPSSSYQLPIVALVCNFNTNTANISHNEVETLFHELGHALHSLLSRTTFQHTSGTRTAMDFVEIPSHLFEYFVYDPTFLKRLLKTENNTPLSDEEYAYFKFIVSKLRQSKQLFQAIEKQNQILYAMLDQQLFGNDGKEMVGLQQQLSPSAPSTTTSTFQTLHQSLNIPYAEGTHWHSRFGHLVTYGAGYYSYLHSQKYALDIWSTLFSNKNGKDEYHDDTKNSVYRESGERLWKQFLVFGGSRDPNSILQDFLQQK